MSWLERVLPRSFWDSVDKIDAAKRKAGIPGPALRPILTQFSLVDSDALRRVGENAWGTGGDHAGIPATTADGMDVLVQRVISFVDERWHGEAFDTFVSSTTASVGLLPKLTAPCQEIGQSLVDIADAFELTWIEILGWIATALAIAATILSIADLIPFDEVGVGILALIIGVISVAISLWVSYAGSKSRFGTLDSAVEEINKAIDEKFPRTDDAPVPMPQADQWRRDSADPVS